MPLDYVKFGVVEARRHRGRASYEFGQASEAAVARHYENLGYDLAEIRWRGAGGEIDLIFSKGDMFVFVEVKASKTHADAASNLGSQQMVRICASAEDYIGRQPNGLLTEMRIDVALVDQMGRIEVLENALM